MLDSPGSDDGMPHHQFYLLVTELPEQVSEQMLMEFFQDRRQSGGGSVSSIDLNQSARSAAVYFHDSEGTYFMLAIRICKQENLVLRIM